MAPSCVKNKEEKINILKNLENTKNDKEKNTYRCLTKKREFKKKNLESINEIKEKNKEEKLNLKNIKSNSSFKIKQDIKKNKQKNNLVYEDVDSQLLKNRKKLSKKYLQQKIKR